MKAYIISSLASLYHFLLKDEKEQIYPTLDPPREVYNFFQRLKPSQEDIEDSLTTFSRGNNGGGAPAPR